MKNLLDKIFWWKIFQSGENVEKENYKLITNHQGSKLLIIKPKSIDKKSFKPNKNKGKKLKYLLRALDLLL